MTRLVSGWTWIVLLREKYHFRAGLPESELEWLYN